MNWTLVALLALPPAASACPDLDQIKTSWVEEAILPEGQGLPRSHWPQAPAQSAPLLLPVQGEQHWFGLSHRSDLLARSPDEPGCFLTGSAAFYVIGPEDDPQVDFLKLVSEGRERELAPRLIELRWFDPADQKRHRWYDRALARRLGWPEKERPIPLHTSGVNSLY